LAAARALLDTDVIIWHLRGHARAQRWIQQLSEDGVPCCCALSVAEVAAGARIGEAEATRAFLDALDVIPVSGEIAWMTGRLMNEYTRRGVTLDFVDATIAATCLTFRLRLATYNTKHFPMPGLEMALTPR
jgi:predicted nucleic acid-binding protein